MVKGKKNLFQLRNLKRAIAVSLDTVLCCVTVWLAFFLRLDLSKPPGEPLIIAMLLSVFLAIPLFIFFRFYHVIFRHSGFAAVRIIAVGSFAYWISYAGVIAVLMVDGIPRSVGLVQPIFLFLAISATRVGANAVFDYVESRSSRLTKKVRVKAIIYGTDDASREIMFALKSSPKIEVSGFVDDDINLCGNALFDIPIYGLEELHRLVSVGRVSLVLVSFKSKDFRRRNEIMGRLADFPVEVRLLPSMSDIANGDLAVSNLLSPKVDDLLGRQIANPDELLLSSKIFGKTVLITGAGGSIGSELVRQIFRLRPFRLVLIDMNEFALYTINAEIENILLGDESRSKTEVIPLLASVQDEIRIREIFEAFKPDSIFHAAAYKHVPMVERNVLEAVKNNILGTTVVAVTAVRANVSNFVFVSTDKAVRPTNVMGATKRFAEQFIQSLSRSETQVNLQSEEFMGEISCDNGDLGGLTTFSIVRFGNVLDSNGSVLPKFRHQINEGGPVTVTDPEVTRFFMTIPEAAQLVIQAGALAEGGEIFLLEMGSPIKILDLARSLIKLSGLSVRDTDNPDGDIEIIFTGLRAGEKLHEELLVDANPEPTSHKQIYLAREPVMSWSEIKHSLKSLRHANTENNVNEALSILMHSVPGFHPSSKGINPKMRSSNKS